MKKALLAFLAASCTCLHAVAEDNRKYDVTILELRDTEQLLLHQYEHAVGLRKFEIERQLKEVRRQRMEIERLRAEAAKAYHESRCGEQKVNVQQTQIIYPNWYGYGFPKENVRSASDWKEVETPDVVVKGIIKFGDTYGAFVSGGKIVYSNDVFSTTYQGSSLYWRVTGISLDGATFVRVNPDGSPLEMQSDLVEEPASGDEQSTGEPSRGP